MNSSIKWVSIAAATLVTVGLLMTGCSDQPQTSTQDQQKNAAVAVSVQKVALGSVGNSREYTARLKPIQDVMIIPKLPGKVTAIPVEIGDAVKKGDLLLELDTSDIQPQIDQAQAAYNVAKINVNDTKKKKEDLDNMEKKLKDQQNSLTSQQKQLNDTVKQLQSQLNDLKKQLASAPDERVKAQLQSTIDALESQLSKAQDGLSSVNEALKAVQTQISSIATSKMQIPSDELLNAQLKQAEAALNLAKHQLTNTKIYAPIDGIVASVNVDEGEMVAQTTLPMNVIDVSKLLMDIQVAEADISKIQKGQSVNIKVDAVPDQTYNGTVTMISPTPDPRSQNYPVSIQIDNKGNYLKAGMFARAELAVDKKTDVIVVPSTAVLDENGIKVVYVADGGKAQKQQVEIGMDDGKMVEIKKGLDVGQNIVVEGQQYLTDGADITIAE
ncbi:efflux RND transporter periplasmic adaptor subunit [Mahella australiensis]|uniref:Efflux transporter, RND family, MFP subunit n=1 Tax=Mahella australiensis (strain DSM 15567 / CIP 107919 / 50-1 BON) TaxID=697281 RepID=F3ZZN4_MAHA5|nr:efflux RND transporter periplasmic adaptor subunit [Mahella australiensis]AEE96860.1 efflux transporter, RND family, MFP subunit [Mahella australiensis 50-1 BON]